MYIYGSFLSQRGDTVTVHIVTNGDRSRVLEIGTEESGIYFTDNPAETGDEVGDTFDVLLRRSATVRLYCANLVPDFFCTSCRDAVVNICKEGRCVFAGFIEPQSYSQPYNDIYDEVELNCIDALSGLQYSKYKNIGSPGVAYALVRQQASQRSFLDLIVEATGGVTDGIDIAGGGKVRLWYDGSKAINAQAENRYGIFGQLSVSDLLFMGSNESDVWQQDEVVENILKYLNLHIVQDGLDFYIFSWETVRNSGGQVVWTDLRDGTKKTTSRKTVTISLANASDDSTTISIGEAYNQLLLTANIETMDDVIESPLEESLLDSPFANKQLYMTEYSVDGEGTRAYKAMTAMVKDESTDYGAGAITDWYVQVKRNSRWTFPMSGDPGTDLVDYFCAAGTKQHALPVWLGTSAGAAILSLGSVTKNTATDDSSPTSKVEMTNYMVISVNGNENDTNEGSGTYPSEESIKRNIPYAIYKGNSAGGVFSPSDDNTTNYIVLSGRIILNPLMKVTGPYKDMRERMGSLPAFPPYWHETVPSRKNSDGRYYTRKYWKTDTPEKEPEWYDTTDSGFYPYTGEGPEEYAFKYSAVGDSSDKVSKVAVLACMLVIGDKCVVEKTPDNDQGDKDADGAPVPYTDDPNEAYKNFVWREYKERASCSSDDEYYQQSFTIGFDPKRGDKLIGREFDLQKTFSYRVGIDAEGIGIRIRRCDKVAGAVRFMILGPVNVVWDEYTRRHPTFFRHTKWSETSVPLLAHVSSILIKSFEMKVYSDNGLSNNGSGDSDIVYMSDTRESFVNKKDDIEFKINSALTANECAKLGVRNTVKLSTPLNMATGEGVLRLYDRNRGVTAKPEQMYVDSYYREYHKPRVVMEQGIADADDGGYLFAHYRHEALGKEFFVQGMGRNLIEGSVQLKLKETADD